MKKNNLGILLRVQWQSTMGANRSANAKNPKLAGKKAGYMVLMIFAVAMIVGVACGFCVLMAESLAPMNLLYVLPAITMTAACLASLFTTIYKTNGLLFGFRDYDMVMALPIKTSTIIISRLLILYGMNMLFCMAILIPSAIVYAIYAAPPIGFYPVFVVCMLLVPFIPVVLATIIGSLIAFAASHFKRKNGANVVITLVLLLVWMVFAMNMSSIAANFATVGEDIMRVINQVYPPTAWYTQALCSLDMGAFLLFIGVSVGAFAAFVAIVAKNFAKMNATITANRTTSNYKMQELKQTTPRKALFKKELKRLTSSSVYMLNTAIGVILLTIVSVLMLVMGADRVMSMLNMPQVSGMMATVVPIGMSFLMVMTCTSACSISLEGKSLWIIKSMPIRTKDILISKLWVNLMLVLVAVLINSTIFAIVFETGLAITLMMYLTPLMYGVFTALFGLRLNLTYPNFEWDSEVKVIKQGAPMMIVVFVGMAITIIPAMLTFVVGPVVLYAVTAALIVVNILLYRNVMTKGASTFDTF